MRTKQDREMARRAASACLDHARGKDYCGPDPYDGLNGFPGRVAHGMRTRQVATQLIKRSPVGVRGVLGVRQVKMAKALALFASGAEMLGRGVLARQLIGELIDRRAGAAWGYEFDVQTRWAFYPAYSPNIIATSYAVEAIAAVSPERLPSDSVRNWLDREMFSAAGWVRYVPASQVLVHNANVLGARSYALVGGDRRKVSRALAITLAAQRRDGSWPYGEGRGLEWVDNFHTVYVLRALWDMRWEFPEVIEPVERGVAFWLSNLFTSDGIPLYSLPGHRKADVHNISTALRGLVQFTSLDERAERYAMKTLSLLLQAQAADGSFRTSALMPSFMRWNNAHAFEALAYFSSFELELS